MFMNIDDNATWRREKKSVGAKNIRAKRGGLAHRPINRLSILFIGLWTGSSNGPWLTRQTVA